MDFPAFDEIMDSSNSDAKNYLLIQLLAYASVQPQFAMHTPQDVYEHFVNKTKEVHEHIASQEKRVREDFSEPIWDGTSTDTDPGK